MKKSVCLFPALLCILLLNGCNSILFKGNFKVKSFEPETVPPVWDIPEPEQKFDKYDGDGNRAFYILKGHEDNPAGIREFKLLDFIDGRTTIYAYVTPYFGQDDTGFFAQGPNGQALEKTEDSSGYESTGKIVTVLMAYHTDTGEYQVFYCRVTKADEGKTEKSQLFAEIETGIMANKVAEDYFIYHEGIGYLFSKDGTPVTQQNLINVINENIIRYKGGNDSSVTISDVIMDKNHMIYIPMLVEDASFGSYENPEDLDDVEEEELSDESGKLKKVICCCLSLNMGSGSEPPVYFTAVNENALNQEKMWCGDERHPDIREVKRIFPDSFREFQLNQKPGPILCGYPYGFSYYYYYYFNYLNNLPKWPVRIYPENIEAFKNPEAMLMAYDPFAQKYFYIGDQKELKQSTLDGMNVWSIYKQMLFNGSHSGDWFESMEPVTKTIERTYTTVETSPDGEGGQTETLVEHTQEQELIVSWRLNLKKDTVMTSSMDWYTSDLLAPGIQGVIRFGKREGIAFAYSLVSYGNVLFSESGRRELDFSVVLPLKNVLTAGAFSVVNGECLALFAETDMVLYHIWEEKNEPSGVKCENYVIPYWKLNFTDDKENNPDSYGTNNIKLQNNYLITASLYNGIVKYSLKDNYAVQVSPHSYYGIWEQPDKSFAAIGFENESYSGTYTPIEISKARVYRIDLDSPESALWIIKKEAARNPDFKRLVSDKNNWDRAISLLGLEKNKAGVTEYFRQLSSLSFEQEKGVSEFCSLARIRPDEDIRKKLQEVRYVYSLEEFIIDCNRNKPEYTQLSGGFEDLHYKILSDLKIKSGLDDEAWEQKLQSIIDTMHRTLDD